MAADNTTCSWFAMSGRDALKFVLILLRKRMKYII
jgi:hypothetical protein